MFSFKNQLVLSNKDVCKKLELKILNYGKMADIFMIKKNFKDFQKKIQIQFLGCFRNFFEYHF